MPLIPVGGAYAETAPKETMNISIIPRHILMKQEWLGFRVLSRHLGWLQAMGLGIEMKRMLASGEPWSGMDAPADPREQWSREQIGPAIVLYQLLAARHLEDPLNVTREVVTEGAVPWMQWAVGTIDPERYRSMSETTRTTWFKEKTKTFVNMTIGTQKTRDDGASFVVNSCSFPTLCERAGVPELAPIFCAVDAHYFGSVQKGIILNRPSTLADSGEHCSFSFTWDETEEQK